MPVKSPSSRRAWIEITLCARQRVQCRVALLAEGVDRNSPNMFSQCSQSRSPSSRRAWIEIESCQKVSAKSIVALLAEGVDRNDDREDCEFARTLSPSSRRAWIEIARLWAGHIWPESPSSRRAWIEIHRPQRKPRQSTLVALLAEGVDRNTSPGHSRHLRKVSPSSRRAWIEIAYATHGRALKRSPSSRRAWIEMSGVARPSLPFLVALLAEGVDRNLPLVCVCLF